MVVEVVNGFKVGGEKGTNEEGATCIVQRTSNGKNTG
jgi:hypothetical protein